MTINAEVVGGPYDGRWVALESPHHPWRFVLPLARPGIIPPSDESLHLGPPTIEVRPELTRNGWVLRWPQGVH